MCRIHKFYEVPRVAANPYVFKSFAKPEKKEENFKNEIPKAEIKKPTVSTEKIIRDAREQADNIIKKAKQDAARMLNTSSIEGYNKGLASAKAKVDEAIQGINQRMDKLSEDVRVHTEGAIKSLEDDAVDFSLGVAKKILDVQLERDDAAIASVVRQALRKLQHESSARVILPAEDLLRLQGSAMYRELIEESGVDLEFSVDAGMERGDVLVKTDSGIIDAGINTQFSNIKTLVSSL